MLTEWLGFWALSLPWAQVQFVVAELRSLKLCSPAKKFKKKKKRSVKQTRMVWSIHVKGNNDVF